MIFIKEDVIIIFKIMKNYLKKLYIFDFFFVYFIVKRISNNFDLYVFFEVKSDILLFYELVMLRLNEVFQVIDFLFLFILVLNKDLSEDVDLLLSYVLLIL